MTIEFDDLIPSNKSSIEFDDLIPKGPGFTDQLAGGIRALFGNIVTPLNAADKVGQLSNAVNPSAPTGSVFDRVKPDPAPFNFARASSVQRAIDDQMDRQAQFGTIGPIVGPKPSVSSVATGLLTDLIAGGKATRAGINQMAGDISGSDYLLGQAKKEAAQADLMRAVNTPEFETETGRGIYGGLSSTVRQLPAIAAAVATRNPNIALGGMVAPMVPEEYGKFRQRGADPLAALAGATGSAATEYFTEKMPMGFLVRQFGRAGAGQFLTGMLAREVPGEQVATLVQDAIDTAIANPDKTWGDYIAERPGAAYQTLLATITQSGVMGGANAVANRLTRPQQAPEPTLPDYQDAASRVFGRATPPAPQLVQPPAQPPAAPEAEVVNRILQAIEQTQNVQNVPPTARAQAETPATQAPAPAAVDAAAPAVLPDQGRDADVQAAGLTFDDLVPAATEAAPVVTPKAPMDGAITDEGTKPDVSLTSEGKTPILQNRNRATPSSIAQMQSIATQPDYGRLGFSRDFANGAPVVAGGQIAPEQLGRQDVAVASDGRRIPVQYAVVEASDVLPSNQADGTTNVEYGDQAVQRIRAIAGNGRIAGLQLAYRKGTTPGYINELANDALHGVSPDVIRAMRAPVLVRVMPVDQVTADIGDVSNTVGNLNLSAVEQANNDAQRVNLDTLQFAEDGSITPEAVRQFVRAMPQAEQGGLIDTNGQPTKQAVDRINAAVFARAYGNDQLIRLFAQAQDPEARNVLSALAQVAPKMARLEGAGALDIRDVVTQAAEIAVNARREGKALSLAAQQLDMAADPMVGVVLDLFAANARTVKPVVEALSNAADLAYTEATKPAEDMFGAVPRASRTDVINQLRPQDERASQENLEQPAGREPVQVDAGRTEAEPAAAADPAAAEAGRPAEAEGLTSYTPEEVTQRIERLEQAEAERKAAEAKAEQGEARERERREVRRRSEAAADTFELGQDPMANLTGQGDIFSAPAEPEDTKDSGPEIPVNESRPAQREESSAGAKPIDDFGEKLGGAKKDRAPSLSKELTDEDIATKPFSQIWPAAEIDGIEDKFAAAVAFAARAEVPAKPRVAYKVNRWVEKVKVVRGLAQWITSGKYTPAEFMDKLREMRSLNAFGDKVQLLNAIDRSQWARIGEVEAFPDAYRIDDDGKRVPSQFTRVQIDGKTHNIPVGNVIAAIDRVDELLAGEAEAKKMQFEIRQNTKTGEVFINKKGDKEYRKLKTFADAKQARIYIKDNYDDLVAAWEAVKESDNVKKTDVRSEVNRPRTGADRRGGQDVTPEQFSETFGFRGVEFGNWVGQGANAKERQGMLNQAYDALMDLAEIAGIPPKAISLNGSMGLAFGSRGSGKAAAHFEPSNLVINLTKTKGAGSLAHEWFHALDNYFARQRGGEVPMQRGINAQEAYRTNNYITYRPEPLYIHKTQRSTPITKAKLQRYHEQNPKSEYYNPDNWQVDPKHPNGVRPEVERAFAELVEALDQSPMAQRAASLDKAPEGYWSRIIERGARAFESYVITKMMERGYQNDYLANVRPVDQFPRSRDRYPYLLPEEVAPIAEAFDNLFGTIETKETDKGVMLFEPEAAYNAEAPRRTYTDDRQLQLFLDNGPDQSQAGPRGEAAQREAVAAVDDLRSTETILGLALSRDYAARQRVSLVGQKVSSAEDLAVLAQVYRDPRFETFRVVFVTDSGKVVSQVGLTSRLPAAAPGIMGNDVDAYLGPLMATARNLGASGYYMLHNHPSGIARTSRADEALTNAYANYTFGTDIQFRGHVVIDTNEYSVINGRGESTLFKKDFGQPAPYRAQEWADVQISGPDDVMSMAKRLQLDDGAITLIHTDNQYRVKAISTIPNDASTMSKQELKKLVLKASLKTQGAQVFAVGRDSQALARIGTMVVDAIYVEDGGQAKSLRSMGAIGGGSPLPESRRTRVSPDTSPEFAYLRRQSQPVQAQRVAEDGPEYETVQSSSNRDALGRFKFRLGEVALGKLDAATRPLQERFGMRMASPELRRQLRQMKATIEEAKRAAVDVAKEMSAMPDADRAMVSDIVEKMIAPGVVPPEHAVRVADAITRTMDQQTDELVALGMLSADSAERWRGRYLPRIYNRQTELADDSLIKRLFKTGTPTMQGIGGGSLKGRGLFQDVSVDAVDQWLEMGYEVRDPHWKLVQGKLELKDPNAPQVARDQVTVWRDWTPSERAQMGENRDAMYRFVMGYTAMQRDIALGRLFNNIANNPEWVRRSGADGWVQVPNTEIPDTGGVKRYGNLAGLWVRRDVMSHLTQFEEAANDTLQLYREALGVWKEGKTALNPVAHFNNVMSNVSMAHFAGVSYWDGHKYAAAVRDLANDAPMVDEARKVGLFTGSFTKEEMVQAMPPDLQKLMELDEGRARKAGKQVMNALTFWLRKPLRDAYEFEDSFFKYLIYRDARQQGMSPEAATDYALRYIFTYDDLPSGARKVRDYAIPFFSWTYKAAPALLHTAMVYPWRFLAPAAVLHGINLVAYALAAGDEDDNWLEKLAKGRDLEKEERKALPERTAGTGLLLNPKTIRLGNDSVTGNPVFLDASRVVPGGDMFDMVNQAGGLPLPAPLMPNHPVLSAFSAMIANKEMFMGREVTDKNDTSLEAAEKRAKWMAGFLLPAVAPGGYHSQRIADAAANAMDTVIETPLGDFTGVDRSGQPVQPKYAAMQTVGIKARPVDLELELERKEARDAALIRSIAAEVRSLSRLHDRGAVSYRMLEESIRRAEKKIDSIELEE